MTVTPAAMPARKPVRVLVPMAVLHAHCSQGARCVGPGCVVSTGKTARKAR
jgi:hypothetical protein